MIFANAQLMPEKSTEEKDVERNFWLSERLTLMYILFFFFNGNDQWSRELKVFTSCKC